MIYKVQYITFKLCVVDNYYVTHIIGQQINLNNVTYNIGNVPIYLTTFLFLWTGALLYALYRFSLISIKIRGAGP